MMKKTDISITRFENSDFWIDVVDDGTVFRAYLMRKGYGVSSLMFGAEKKNITFSSFLYLVQCNLDEYVDLYIEEFCDLNV